MTYAQKASSGKFKKSIIIDACTDCIAEIDEERINKALEVLTDATFMVITREWPFMNIRKLTESEIDKYIKDKDLEDVHSLISFDNAHYTASAALSSWDYQRRLCFNLKHLAENAETDYINISLDDYHYIKSYLQKE